MARGLPKVALPAAIRIVDPTIQSQHPPKYFADFASLNGSGAL
jgi:hypothetical protein